MVDSPTEPHSPLAASERSDAAGHPGPQSSSKGGACPDPSAAAATSAMGPSTAFDSPSAHTQALLDLATEVASSDGAVPAVLRRIAEIARPIVLADRTTVRTLGSGGRSVKTLLSLDHRSGELGPSHRRAAAQEPGWEELVAAVQSPPFPPHVERGNVRHVPVLLEGQVAGFVDFEMPAGAAPWSADQSGAARVAGQLVGMAEAVRRRKEKERLSRLREQIHDAIVDIAQDYIFVVNADLDVVYLNAYAAAAARSTPEQIIGTKLERVFPPETFARQKRNLLRVFETGKPVHVETETGFPDGVRWLDTWLLPLHADDGSVHSIVGISRDTTDRKQAEQALRRSEARYRTLVDLSPDSISMTDLEGRFLLVNQRGLEMQGARSLEELQASRRSAFDIISPEDRAKAVEHARKTLEEGQITNVEYRMCRADGTTFPAELNAAVVPDEQGQPRAFVGIVRDISARRSAERALAAEKERLLVTLASIAEGVVTTDANGRVELLNRVAEDLTGWPLDEARGRLLGEVLRLQQGAEAEAEPDTLTDAVGAMAKPKRLRRSVLVARDGTQRRVAASAAPIRWSEGGSMGVVVVFHDVTDREKLEREVQRVESLESVGILAAGVAHDVNNIMTAILGNVSLAKALAPSDGQVLERLAEAERAIGRAKDLTQQLLGFARGTTPEKRTANIAELIRETARFAARGSSSAVHTSIEPGLWAVDVDQAQITQVVSNLVINALQAQPGGGTVDVTASNVNLPADATLPLPDGPYVKIAVRDHGVGIARENLSRIFDPYFTTKTAGSGLGLTICHVIVRNHGGHLTAESTLGVGTTFLAYLPASQARARASGRQVSGVVRGQGRILVVDDDRAIRDVSELMLEFLGYQVETAAGGEQAIDLYREALEASRRFDAVVLDLTMPGGLSGDATMARLLELDASAVGIVASGYSEDPVMVERAKYGFRGAVAKPFRIEELSQVLAAALRERES